jgi:glycogen synthase
MNGIETTEWNPKTDKFLKPEWRFDLQDFDTKKVAIKLALQEKLGLIRDPTAALYVFIGRLTEQKGVDVLLAALPMVFVGSPAPSPQQYALECHRSQMESSERGEARMIQMAMLGTGDSWMERSLECLSLSFPGYAAGLALFSEELAHLMLAAADYVIVPSRFEPCGLIAQCALRYGAVPIVTAVGGLRDLVTSDVGHVLPSFSCANEPAGQQEDIKRVSEMIKRTALECGSLSHRKLQQSSMQKDLSWDKPAEEWEDILNQVARKRGGCIA